MTWFRKLRGLDFPDPVVGQVWQSMHSGRRMRVSDVHIQDSGSIFVYIEYDHDGEWGIGTNYCIGLSNWRWRLRDEKRVLVAENVAHMPLQPPSRWP